MKYRFIWGMVIGFTLFPAIFALADGADLFARKCESCHKIEGQAAPVNPADKAGIVWVKYFKRGRHPVDLRKNLNDEELKSVVQYLQEHAADSDRPAMAAIPN